MHALPPGPGDSAALRRLAEKKLGAAVESAMGGVRTDTETQRLLHELQVHQVELEMQNEELVRTRSELEASVARYTELYDFAPTGYFSIQRDGQILRTNHAGANLLGLERSRLIHCRFHAFVAEAFLQAFTAFLNRSLDSEKTQTDEFELKKAEGGPLWVRIDARCVTTGVTCQFVLVDITARKRAESQKEQLHAQLLQSQKVEVVGRLAGGVAHDFNNLLCAMLLQLNLMEERPGLDSQTKQGILGLRVEAVRAASLTRQLLMFSRKAHAEQHPVDLNELVENLLKMLRRLAGEPYVLELSGQGRLPLINADVGMLEQVVMNLVVNARDSMPEGGLVTLRTREEVLSEADCSGALKRRAGAFVVLEVSDHGCGIQPEILSHIFEPFFTTKEVGRGTGLGLSTVDGIVELHEGWVEVESMVGVGTSFRLFFPVLATPRAVSMPAPAPVASKGSETILLVEDELPVRLIISKSLEGLGYRVVEAKSPKEAFELWTERGAAFDLLLTDMVMPGGETGLDLARKLQRLNPKLPALIITGYRSQTPLPSGVDCAETEILEKPFDLATLSVRIRRRLGKS